MIDTILSHYRITAVPHAVTTRELICRGRIVCGPSQFVGRPKFEQAEQSSVAADGVTRIVIGPHKMRPLRRLWCDPHLERLAAEESR